jgi:hypothetical protein
LLVAVPGISFFVYPVIAFHDGWLAPHKRGAPIGLLLALGSITLPYSLLEGAL